MTVIEIAPKGEGVSCTLTGDLVIPRLIARRGHTVDVALVAGRAMLLPGDEVDLRIRVGAGCELRLVDIGGLVVYGRPGSPDEPARWHARIDLDDDAALTWDGLPTVITDAGALTRSLTIHLADRASALLRETLVLGRTGERGGRLRADTEVRDAAGPLLRDTLDVRGDRPVPGVLGRTRVADSVLALGTPLLDEVHPAGTTRLDLERGGTILRYLGDAAHDSPLAGFIRPFPSVAGASRAAISSPPPPRSAPTPPDDRIDPSPSPQSVLASHGSV